MSTSHNARVIQLGEWFHGARASLRLITVDDCTERYVAWLNDPEVSRYLETRCEPTFGPRLAHGVGVSSAIELGLHQRHHVNTVHGEVLHQSVDLDIDQDRPDEAGTDQGHLAELRTVEPAVDKPCVAQIIALKCGH